MSKCNGPTRRVNMKGGAGIGKSTCCQCIVSCWANGSLFQEFDVLLWIPLRNLTSARYPNGDRVTLVDLAIRECVGQQPSPALRSQMEDVLSTSRVLWILDGYDEIVGRVPEHLQGVYDEMMCSSQRLLTGRPNAMSNTVDINLARDIEVEVAGFTDENIRTFVGRFVRSVGGRLVDAETQLVSQLRRSRVAWELAHIPVNLVLMCHVLLDAIREGASVDSIDGRLTLSQLYGRVEMLLWKRYCGRSLKGVDVTSLSSSEILKLCENVEVLLRELAFVGMREGVVMLPGEVVVEKAGACGVSIEQLLACGFIVQAVGAGSSDDVRSTQFHFLHLTLQEYFAGKYVASVLMASGTSESSDVSWLRQHKDGGSLEVMWWFVAGELARISSADTCELLSDRSKFETGKVCCVCSVKLGLMSKKGHCKLCGRSVCQQHSETRIPNKANPKKPARVCDVCAPRPTVALKLLASWWIDSLKYIGLKSDNSSKIKLWLQLAEQAVSVGVASADFDSIVEIVTKTVRSDVDSALKDRLTASELVWFGTLQQCPRMSKLILFDWPLFKSAVKDDKHVDVIAQIVLLLSDVVPDSPELMAFLHDRVRRRGKTNRGLVLRASAVNELLFTQFVSRKLVSLPECITACDTFDQTGAAACLVAYPTLLEDPAIVEACGKAYICSDELLNVLCSRNDMFPWAKPRSQEARRLEGKHVATLALGDSLQNTGLAVNDDATLMATSSFKSNMVTVAELPSGKALTSFGGTGAGYGQFHGPQALCFTVDRTLLVADFGNKRIVDMTTVGKFVRNVGSGMLKASPLSVAANGDGIVVSQQDQTCPLYLFDYRSGDFVRSICNPETLYGCAQHFSGICLSRDGRHVIGVADKNLRMACFDMVGHHTPISCPLSPGISIRAVCLADNGDIVAIAPDSQQVLVFLPDGGRVVKRFGSEGATAGKFKSPSAIAFAKGRLYVLDWDTPRVQVFK